MSGPAVTVIFVIAAILLALVWTLYLAAGLVLGMTAFAVSLPLLLFVVMFIVLPPPLVVVLVGCAVIVFGIIGRSNAPNAGKPDSNASERSHTCADND